MKLPGVSRIAPKQYQGSRPPVGLSLYEQGIQVLVLCEAEWQPSAVDFPNILVIHCPLEDELEPMAYEDRVQVTDVAREVTALLSRNLRTLVTCYQGRNRSGLVNAMVLMNRYGITGDEAIRRVRVARPTSLVNPHFCEAIRKTPPRASVLRPDRSVAL